MSTQLFSSSLKKLFIWILVLVLLFSIFTPGQATTKTDDPIGDRTTRQGIKEITMYMHNSTSARYIFDYSTMHVFNTTLGNQTNSIWDQQRVRMNWYLHPLLAGDFRVNGNVSMVLYINTKGVSANANLYVDIYEVTYKSAGSETSTLIYSGSDSSTITSGIDSYEIQLQDVEHTFSAGSSIRIYYEIQGGASAEFGLWYGNTTFDSRITFQAYDYLEIAEVSTYNHQDQEKTNFEIDVPSKVVKMRANITDPFGGYDINMVQLSLKGPTNNEILNNVTMTKIAGTPISFINIYEAVWNYTGAQIGQYQFTVYAVDNNGYYYYYHKENFNFGNYLESESGDFIIGGLPRVGLIKVLDLGTPQSPLEGAVVKILKGNNVLFTNITNSTGHVGINTFQGTYDIIVEWQDVVVGNQFNFNIDQDFNLTIDTDVFYPQFKVVDNNANPLEGANIYLGHPNGSFLVRPYTTDENGIIDIDKAPIGDYNLIVKWRDVEVADETHLVDRNGLIATITTKVFEVKLKCVDSRDISIPGAQITFAISLSKLILDSKLTDLNGEVISQLPAGEFNITVYWEQRVIQQFELDIVDDFIDTIVCWVYYVNLVALDPAPHEQPVENARVLLTAPESGGLFGSQLTNSVGGLESRLPVGLVDINVYWKSTLVNTTQVDITGNVPADQAIELICDIYYLTLRAVDSKTLPIENAQVTIIFSSNNEVADTQITDSTGRIVSRVPRGNFDISTRWYDTDIYHETERKVDSDLEFDLNCWVYYIEIKTVDSKNRSLSDAQIAVTMIAQNKVIASGSSNSNGTFEVRLPIGVYDFNVTWEGVLVREEKGYNVVADADLFLKCKVYYLNLLAVDIKSLPLENAQITLMFSNGGRVYDSTVTDLTGTMESRLPVGEYDIDVIWKGVNVYSESGHSVDADEQYTLNAKVYYLTIKAMGTDSESIKDVSVTIRDPDDMLIENIYTDKNGRVEFRLPQRSYTVKARLQTTHYYKEIDQTITKTVDLTNNSKEIKLKFSSYPPAFTDTPVFGIIVGVIIFIIIILLLWLLVIKKLKNQLDDQKGKDEEEEPEEPQEEAEEEPETSMLEKESEISDEQGTAESGSNAEDDSKSDVGAEGEGIDGVEGETIEPEVDAEMEEMEKMDPGITEKEEIVD
jgi:hypothetical protein